MSERISVPGEILARVVGEFLLTADISASSEWLATLESVRSQTFSASVAEKGYWLDVYRRRRDVARSVDTGLVGDLARVVDDFSKFDGDNIALVIINRLGHGYFVWMSPDLSSVVSCFRGTDKRFL